jgi:hypothetical protein
VIVARVTDIAVSTIGRGLRESKRGGAAVGQIRRYGGGRKKLIERDSGLQTITDGSTLRADVPYFAAFRGLSSSTFV